MGNRRAEMRRAERNKKSSAATYNLTKGQLDLLVQGQVKERFAAEIREAKEEAAAKAVNDALVLLLALPLEVLMDYYWTDDYAEKIPEFAERVLDYYNRWEDGEFTLDELREDIWKYAGIRLEGGVEDAKN